MPDTRPYTTRRMRWRDFNYSSPGYYFITICQQDRKHLFGRIDGAGHTITPAGSMVISVNEEIVHRFSHTILDSAVVMPNHVHLLLGINLDEGDYEPTSVIAVVHWWKTRTTTLYGKGVKSGLYPRYQQKLWQEGYHDRVVRDQRELEYIRHYIQQNPVKWAEDTFYEEM